MNLRRKAAETLETVQAATVNVSDLAAIQTLLFGLLSLAVIVAIGLGLKGLAG